MKKPLSYFAIIMLVATAALTSCDQQQNEKEVPLMVTYTIDCSKDLLNLCDLVVTYKGNDGVDVVDTITVTDTDTTSTKSWTKTIQTHKVPVKIGMDYTLVQKTDTLSIDQPTAQLDAWCTIIVDKIGIVNRNRSTSEKIINSKHSFFVVQDMIREAVPNTRQKLTDIINKYNSSHADEREAGTTNTCFIVKPYPHSEILTVRATYWKD